MKAKLQLMLVDHMGTVIDSWDNVDFPEMFLDFAERLSCKSTRSRIARDTSENGEENYQQEE